MFSPLFWFFAALTLAFGIGVVVNRNPVASALCLVISFMGLAALLVGLDAYLLGVLQVLVYAGAVMVLFLFIIMLLDLRAEARRKFNWLGIAGGSLVALGFTGELVYVLSKYTAGAQKFPALRAEKIDDVREIGAAIFTAYNFPLQIVGVLLLVATVGVIILSRRELK